AIEDQSLVGNNLDSTADTGFFGMENRFSAQLQASRNWITFVQEGNPNDFPFDFVTVVNPSPGLYGPQFPDTRISRLTDVAGSFEDRLKITPAFALIGGVRLEALTLDRSGTNFDGTVPDGLPFSKTWTPVSYRAAYTYEPIHNLMFYSMYATAYDPAVAGIFSIKPGTLQLTSTRLYETGAKQQLWDGRAEWTVARSTISSSATSSSRSTPRRPTLPARSPARAWKYRRRSVRSRGGNSGPILPGRTPGSSI